MKNFLRFLFFTPLAFILMCLAIYAFSGDETVETTPVVETAPVVEVEAETELPVLSFLDELEYTPEQISDMRTVLTNVGITEITELEIFPASHGMQVIQGLAYKDTSFLADQNDEVQVMFNIENGVIYLVSIYCPSYYSANRPTYLAGLEDRRADLYYDVEGGYLKKIDWENKAVVDY